MCSESFGLSIRESEASSQIAPLAFNLSEQIVRKWAAAAHPELARPKSRSICQKFGSIGPPRRTRLNEDAGGATAAASRVIGFTGGAGLSVSAMS
jgi:hypothetical protein